MIAVRRERPGDRAGVRAVNRAAFPTAMEADLVDALRSEAVLDPTGAPMGGGAVGFAQAFAAVV